ncbi:MAG: bifunctional [glutamate--ammonia ligase]-adenylyl-L-tyrosine phosphorylase/[glutamate--ammonia-ligase] adenylyltransferase [Nitrospirae bacterium]|nr:bifunctional [glutamate--ammonia ligase]-adenylyl-L-tyrosine phosphorylase/[glutamate--ammonia-ligase] adenylyltransferase [Nitrospirota bacterium]MBF0533894.1 bifunctional [glutamate--ammonia ligase]-adenylyl-L-tyrosine phosphorylase/[glutamate--ammonia-ligase] adenylyltransferase [Nitrospirota bacterium]MBF0615397.1 bifunctional [glutamate--ammonia ligase]-adenylyl-L-tyrosine phosphorylase/[glutamate--ammonia-ligase] adenylyltransferase [Nitrospirota bacterium]
MLNINELSLTTPDPKRAHGNLKAFFKEHPHVTESLSDEELLSTAMVFSYSQFLSVYALKEPESLVFSLKNAACDVTREYLLSEMAGFFPDMEINARLRKFKKWYLLLITLRNVTNRTGTIASMKELSALADVLTETALKVVKENLIKQHGEPESDAFSVLALGKLGANELNYSSDVDFICVYGTADGYTDGVLNISGIKANRISNHEFYSKVVEGLSKALNQNTADGFVYRVDLRLRPQGSRGALAMSLGAYEQYYESWGREWERLALIRARHVAGDFALSADFFEMALPFVYRKYIDIRSFDEIKKLKNKIDFTFDEKDIKKGYGGIREIEFFTQALQLVYGGQSPILRERGLLVALHKLTQKNLIGYDDYSILCNNYLYLRKLEHCIQMLDDLQCHSLPTDREQLEALARKMGYVGTREFLDTLKNNRYQVRQIYDSLFGTAQKAVSDEDSATQTVFNKHKAGKLIDELTDMQIQNPEHINHSIAKIRETMSSFQTLQSRKLQDAIMPVFAELSLQSANPEMAFSNLRRFSEILVATPPYLELFNSNRWLINTLVEIFAVSPYLTSIVIGDRKYLDMLSSGTELTKPLSVMVRELSDMVKNTSSVSEAVSAFKKMEELRIGIMYMRGKKTPGSTLKELSRVADAVMGAVVRSAAAELNLCVAGFGKFGGRELTFGSDLDIVFIADDAQDERINAASQKILRTLTAYTKEGYTYKVDTRLRAEGSKGQLVNTINGLKDYYLNKARFWELQALVKARPITGDSNLRREFLNMKWEVIPLRGAVISAVEIISMREKIRRELLKPDEGLNIKLHSGGIEDIEFLSQYLVLKNSSKEPSIIVPGTVMALKRLTRHGFLSHVETIKLIGNYLLYRELETVLRLRGEKALGEDTAALQAISAVLGFVDLLDFKNSLNRALLETSEICNRYMGG